MSICSGLLQTLSSDFNNPKQTSGQEIGVLLFSIDCNEEIEAIIVAFQARLDREIIEVTRPRIFLRAFSDKDYCRLANIITVNGIPLGVWIEENHDSIGDFLNLSSVDKGTTSDFSSTKQQPAIKGIWQGFKDLNRKTKWPIAIGTVYTLHNIYQFLSLFL